MNVQPGQSLVVCAYCGTQFHVQPSSPGGGAARNAPLGAQPPGQPIPQPYAPPIQQPVQQPTFQPPQQVPVHRFDPAAARPAKRSGLGLLWLLVALVLPIGGVGVALAGAFDISISNLWGGFSGQWEGVGRALLVDLNGDGTVDPVGRSRYVGVTDRVHLAAFDGKTGDLIWESESIGTYSETFQGKLSITGTTLLFGSPNGEVWAYSSKDGKRLWQVPVGEKVDRFCSASEGRAGIRTLDKKLHFVHLRDGTAAPKAGGGEKACRNLQHDRTGGGLQEASHTTWNTKVTGMRVHGLWRSARDGALIATGTAATGSAVPMVAVLTKEGKLRWKSEVPGTDRLNAETRAPYKVAFDPERLAVLYGIKTFDAPKHVVVFRMRDGRRLWDQSLPSSMPASSIQLSKNLVLVSTWGLLTAFDPRTGEQLYSIGKSIK